VSAFASITAALAHARELGIDRLDAQLLIAHHSARTRAGVIADRDAALTPKQADAIAQAFARRAAGEPLAYLVGQREFHGLLLRVSPAVLVPRPDTETLVEWALALLPPWPGPRIVDLGTGSGAIALAIKHARADASIVATDASAEALAVARDNARHLALDVDLRAGHWWEAVTGERFHLALSNPPYIAQGDAHLAALQHEPRLALTSGADGLDAIRHIVAEAPQHLAPDGWLLLEHGHEQACAVRALLDKRGFADVCTRHDLAGIERVSGGRWPTNGAGV
jgi:release factor glutamine methyltransferase